MCNVSNSILNLNFWLLAVVPVSILFSRKADCDVVCGLGGLSKNFKRTRTLEPTQYTVQFQF